MTTINLEDVGLLDTVNNNHLVVDSQWCKGCGICVAFCPRQVLALVQGKVQILDISRCIRCSMCEKLCPDYAIYLTKDGQ